MSMTIKNFLPGMLATFFVVCGATAEGATIYVSKTGNDSTCARGNAAAACATFNKAYSIAQAGDAVEVAAGSYASQSISRIAGRTSTVVIAPASGATVTLSGLTINGSYVEVQGMTVAGGCDVTPASGQVQGDQKYVTLRNVHCTTLYFSSTYFSMIGGEIGPYDSCLNTTGSEDGIASYAWNSVPSTNILLDGVKVHDVTDHGNLCSGYGSGIDGRHVDCVQIDDANHVTIRNSQFYNCATSDVLARPWQAGMGDWTIENNFFGKTLDGGNGLALGDTTADSLGGTNVIRNNTMAFGITNLGAGNTLIYGNIINGYACSHGTWSYNVFLNGTGCGTHAKAGSVAFVSNPSPSYMGPVPDLHLASGSTIAAGAGDPANFPATDIDGQARTSPPDAGADQYGAAQSQLPQAPASLTVTVK